MHYPAFMTNW